ncbi:Hypothetical predicted protein [Pelobates cultripes]|uniref:Uncharacterized protein n=1 Tax=Pelobates cultripes TaxID=61616 RepID=A0AAD1WHS7_PELCU|nr:Hypothetical predicted protein [Pelobates cultripes]
METNYNTAETDPCCESRKNFIIIDERVESTDKTSRGMYQLNDMRSFMMTPDEKLERHLNWRFQHVDSWQLPQETSRTKESDHSKYQQVTTCNGKRSKPLHQKKTSLTEQVEEAWTLVTPVPHLRCHCYTPQKIKPILSEGDLQDTQNEIEDLLYQKETLGEKSKWELNWKLDYYLPGYREQASFRHKPAAPQAPQSITKKSCKVDVFERLSAPRRRTPSPCHAITCDAYKLGISNKGQRKKLGHRTTSVFPKDVTAPCHILKAN